jgi:hypothetical protein
MVQLMSTKMVNMTTTATMAITVTTPQTSQIFGYHQNCGKRQILTIRERVTATTVIITILRISHGSQTRWRRERKGLKTIKKMLTSQKRLRSKKKMMIKKKMMMANMTAVVHTTVLPLTYGTRCHRMGLKMLDDRKEDNENGDAGQEDD